ncbi:MAG: M12 family metallo-peptidase [Phycisphaerales bacterium]|nr:M12 family metallo-peptidase [Phycisphaerales bacterium]
MKALDFARPALITIALITLSGQISWAQRLTNSAVNPYMHARANELQGVSNSNLVEINAQPVIGMHYSATIMLEGQPRTLHMDPHSVRAADFAIYRSSADGGLVEVSPGPVRTMRGYVENVPGSRIAGAILPRGLNAKIRMPSGRMYGLVAVTNVIPGASPTTHMLFDLADSTEPSATCGFQPAAVAEAPANPTGGTCETVGPIVARIGCDIDSAFVHGGGGGCSPPGSCGGGTPEDAEARVIANVNEVSAFVFELPPLRTSYEISRIVTRSEEADDIYLAFSNSQSNAILNFMRNEWNTTQGDSDSHLVNLWTGRNLSGVAVGASFPSDVCRPGVSWTEKHSLDLQLLAHETGHSWGASHCDAGGAFCGGQCGVPCGIMRTALFGCSFGTEPEFGPCTIDEILSARGAFSCLQDLGFVPPTFRSGGTVLNEGDTLVFDDVLWGQTTTKTIQIQNNQNCELPIDMTLENDASGRFTIVSAPQSVGPLGTAAVQLQFQSTDFAGDFFGSTLTTTPGLLSGLEFNINLQAKATVENNFPGIARLRCPADMIESPQPSFMRFTWSAADFVESFEFVIRNGGATVFSAPGLRQLEFVPIGLSLPVGQTYQWQVIAHNDFGDSASFSRHFTINPAAAAPRTDVTYANIPVEDNGAPLNLPLNPSASFFIIDVTNRGADELIIDNFQIPDDFQLFGFGEGNIRPCQRRSFKLVSTLTQAQLMQQTEIVDTFEFDTNDPMNPHFVVNLCFRCQPEACVGNPFSGTGLLSSFTQGGCYHFQAPCGQEFIIDNVGGANVGDTIFVEGDVEGTDPNCFPFDFLPYIPNNTVELCEPLGRCCFDGWQPPRLCQVVSESQCASLNGSVWTAHEDCNDPCESGVLSR